MLVDARQRFAERVAKWFNESETLTAADMTFRINQFPDDFIRMIVEEHRKQVEKGRPR